MSLYHLAVAADPLSPPVDSRSYIMINQKCFLFFTPQVTCLSHQNTRGQMEKILKGIQILKANLSKQICKLPLLLFVCLIILHYLFDAMSLIPQTGLKFPVYLRMTQNCWSSCCYLPNVRMPVMCHYGQLIGFLEAHRMEKETQKDKIKIAVKTKQWEFDCSCLKGPARTQNAGECVHNFSPLL